MPSLPQEAKPSPRGTSADHCKVKGSGTSFDLCPVQSAGGFPEAEQSDRNGGDDSNTDDKWFEVCEDCSCMHCYRTPKMSFRFVLRSIYREGFLMFALGMLVAVYSIAYRLEF